MRVLVTGASGMLGSTIVERWRDRHDLYATGGDRFEAPSTWRYRAFDLSQPDHAALVAWARPEAIVHCAALTAVDACETDPERALEVNGRSVERLAIAAPEARLVYVSSDAVLGNRDRPLDEDAPAAPQSAYGRSKLLGEQLAAALPTAIAVRTTVVGWNRDPRKQSFVEWLVRSVVRRQPITLFEDAIFNPIAASLLADELEPLLRSTDRGLAHISGHDAASKHEFGSRLLVRLGIDATSVARGRLMDARFAAPRSADQRLDVSRRERALGRSLPTLDQTLDALVRERPTHLEPQA